MKSTLLLCLGLLLQAMTVCLADDDRTLAFPGAEGYGRYATGGRGGKVYAVTSLDDCSNDNLKEGTFRWAVKQPGKKIVIFKVSGTIYLTSGLNLDCGDLTILGQTAPGDGICLADYPVTISCQNAIIRFIRFRLGNRQVAHHEGDGLGVEEADNIIIDHCTVSWSIDECLSVSDGTNITVQWCIVEQSLCNAGHQKGAHGYGGNWGGRNVSYLHNLIAQCSSRVPRLGGDGDLSTLDFVDIRNNVFYNWGGMGCYGAEATDANFVNNYYKPGPGTDQRALGYRKRICAIGIRDASYVSKYTAFAGAVNAWGHFYIDGNVNPNYSDVTADNWTYGVYDQITGYGSNVYSSVTRDTMRLRSPREYMLATTWSAEEAYRRVLKFAGCFTCNYADGTYRRDCLDSLIVAQVANRIGNASSGSNGATYGFIDCQTDNVRTGSALKGDYKLAPEQVENGAWPLLATYDDYTYADANNNYVRDNLEESAGIDDQNAASKLVSGWRGKLSAHNGTSYTELHANYYNKAVRALADSCYDATLQDGVTYDGMTIKKDILPAWKHEVSTLTFKGYDSKTKQQLFADGFAIQNASGSVAGGLTHCLKLRAQQYRIHVPADYSITKMRIYGYSNYSGTDINVTEVNGTSIATGTYVIDATSGARTTLDIAFDKAVSGSDITVTFSGNAPTVKFWLMDGDMEAAEVAGLSAVSDLSDDETGLTRDLLGRQVLSPMKGKLYIQNHKKYIVR